MPLNNRLVLTLYENNKECQILLFPDPHKLLFIELGVNRGVGNGGVAEIDLYGPNIMGVIVKSGV